MKKLVAVVILFAACASTAPAPAPPVQDPEELNMQATVLALYNVISGPAGRRDWDRMKDLFLPGARMVTLRKTGPDVMTPDDYIAHAKPYFDQNGFFEHPIANRFERYGDIAHVFSTYESRHNANDPAPFARGINSFQLVRVGEQWKILTVLWQQEDPEHQIPARYLAK
jgi:hypothetical protein